jgi:hypothetical protein
MITVDGQERAMSKQEYRDLAIRQYYEEGKIEIDSDAKVSPSEAGAYVQAWVWAYDPKYIP